MTQSSPYIIRHRSRSGNPDFDYWQPACRACGWKSLSYVPNRTVEGKTVARREAKQHRCP